MLDRATAYRICELVSKDISCKAVLSGPNNAALQAAGWSGSIRNFANATAQTFGGEDADDVQRMSCIGISNVTVAVVLAASIAGSRRTGKPAPLPSVQKAMDIPRRLENWLGTWEHHACKVVMADGTDYVFDWWKTLDVWNPWIYKTADWRVDGDNYVPFASFTKFD